MKAHGRYDTTYTATGMTISDTSVHATGRPNAQPGRSQPSAGGAGDSSSRTGSSGAGGGASGPKPQRAAIQKRTAANAASAISANASSSGVTASEPSAKDALVLPSASAARST